MIYLYIYHDVQTSSSRSLTFQTVGTSLEPCNLLQTQTFFRNSKTFPQQWMHNQNACSLEARRGQWAWPNPTIISTLNDMQLYRPTHTKSWPNHHRAWTVQCTRFHPTLTALHTRISPTTLLLYSLHYLSACLVQTSNLSCLVVKAAEYFLGVWAWPIRPSSFNGELKSLFRLHLAQLLSTSNALAFVWSVTFSWCVGGWRKGFSF